MQKEFIHKSVLLDETVQGVLNNLSGTYVDCTLGGGGHSLALGQLLNKDALIVGIDQDDDALCAAKTRLANVACRTILVKSNFSNLDKVLDELGIEKVHGFIFDLGVSSYQLDTAERGFSYMNDGPLDMRMDIEIKNTAFDVVNSYKQEDLAKLFWEYGEERWSKRIAEFIVKERNIKPIASTFELVETIKKAIPKAARQDGPHPAKRTFQAIRIKVNKELEILENSFSIAANRLFQGGKVAIITFHSLEDKIAKTTLKQMAKNCICPPHMPICTCNHKATLKKLQLIEPTEQEIQENPRARSAKLRLATRI